MKGDATAVIVSGEVDMKTERKREWQIWQYVTIRQDYRFQNSSRKPQVNDRSLYMISQLVNIYSRISFEPNFMVLIMER